MADAQAAADPDALKNKLLLMGATGSAGALAGAGVSHLLYKRPTLLHKIVGGVLGAGTGAAIPLILENTIGQATPPNVLDSL